MTLTRRLPSVLPVEITQIFKEGQGFVPGKHNLRRLSVLLRRPMPEGFVWDFYETLTPIYRGPFFWRTRCGSLGCAVGLAHETWPEFAELRNRYRGGHALQAAQAQMMGMSIRDYKQIFYPDNRSRVYGRRDHDMIVPGDVADAIDRYLETGKVTAK